MAQGGHLYLKVWPQDEHVHVEIRDTGSGIAPEHLSRLFEPFCTTKPVGSGTGLGLSLSYSIVKKHQGDIVVHSELGVGSSFTLVLPLKPAAEPSTESAAS